MNWESQSSCGNKTLKELHRWVRYHSCAASAYVLLYLYAATATSGTPKPKRDFYSIPFLHHIVEDFLKNVKSQSQNLRFHAYVSKSSAPLSPSFQQTDLWPSV